MTFVYCDDIHFTRIEGDKFWVNFVYCKIIDSNLTLTPKFVLLLLFLNYHGRKGSTCSKFTILASQPHTNSLNNGRV